MDMREYAGKAFIKLADVRDGPRREIIKDVQPGNYGKPDLIFESGDVLSLNKTNVRVLMRAFGGDSRDWPGCEVEVYPGETTYQGEEKDSVLVRAILPAQ